MINHFDVAEAITAPLGASAEYDPVANPPGRCTQPRSVTAGDALALARGRFPTHELASLTVPSTDAQVFTIWLRPPYRLCPRAGTAKWSLMNAVAQCCLHAANTKCAAVTLCSLISSSCTTVACSPPPGEALIVLQGLAIMLLSLAGISLWLWRAKRRREGAAGHAQTAVGST